jgi:hypothetical protein
VSDIAAMVTLAPLSDIMASAPEGQVPAPGLEAWCEGQRYELIGVGERTATLAPDGGWEGRVSKRHELIQVDPAAVRWQANGLDAKTVFTRLRDLDAETKRARAAYRDEWRGEGIRHGGRARRDQPIEHLHSGGTCSRTGCEARLHAANTTGECEPCQHKCPLCGGPKSKRGKTCHGCGDGGGRPPGAVTVTDRLCAGCGNRLGVRAKEDRCLKCRRTCACGRQKGEEAERCHVCARAAAATQIAEPTLELKPAVPAEPSSLAGKGRGEAEVPVAPGAARPPAPLTLEELPDYVGALLGENERLRDRVVELEAEVRACRERQTAAEAVAHRIQAVVERHQGRAGG